MLGEKIRDFREKKGWNQNELAERIGVTQKSVSKYELNKTQPSYDVLSALSNLFGVSIDYLLGSSEDEALCYSEYDPDMKSFVFGFHFIDEKFQKSFTERLSTAMSREQINADYLAENTKISKDRINAYINGEKEPSLEDLSSMAFILKTTTDYLLGNAPESGYRSHRLLQCFYNLDEDNQDILIGKAKELWKSQNNTPAQPGNAFPSSGTGGTKKDSTPPVAAGSVAL